MSAIPTSRSLCHLPLETSRVSCVHMFQTCCRSSCMVFNHTLDIEWCHSNVIAWRDRPMWLPSVFLGMKKTYLLSFPPSRFLDREVCDANVSPSATSGAFNRVLQSAQSSYMLIDNAVSQKNLCGGLFLGS